MEEFERWLVEDVGATSDEAAGVVADALGVRAAIWLVAVVTFGSGLIAAIRMKETLPNRPARET